MAEILQKSKFRVKKYGEVFTPTWLVKKMCDMLGEESPEAFDDIGKTFLEPACGNGQFLVEILTRTLEHCETVEQGLTALKSIYGIDIMQDNVEESKKRMFDIFIAYFPKAPASTGLIAADILQRNIVCGDSLHNLDGIMHAWESKEEYEKCGK